MSPRFLLVAVGVLMGGFWAQAAEVVVWADSVTRPFLAETAGAFVATDEELTDHPLRIRVLEPADWNRELDAGGRPDLVAGPQTELDALLARRGKKPGESAIIGVHGGITYAVALAPRVRQRTVSRLFLAYVRSRDGRAIAASRGFTALDSAALVSPPPQG